jgi:uncharacterized protein YggE
MGTTRDTAQIRTMVVRVGRAAGLVVAVVMAGAVVAACSSTAKPAADPPTCGGAASKLTVEGTGLASGTPDLLTVSVGIDVTDPTANGALTDDNTKAAAVTAVLTQGGVAAKDVQTSDVSINPQYNLKGVITGYEVTNTLTAMLRNFATAGSVIDAIAGAAGNATRLDGLNFSVEDTRALEDQARTDAVHQAVAHARSMALAAGERLGPVCSLSDQSQTDIVNQSGAFASGAEDKASASVPLQPGSQQETAQVTMVYALMPAPLRK